MTSGFRLPGPVALLVSVSSAVEAEAPLDGAAGIIDAKDPARGETLVKVGFAGIVDARRVDALLAAAVRGCALGDGSSGVIAVAYADAAYVPSIDAECLVDVAARSGTRGVLVDTADK